MTLGERVLRFRAQNDLTQTEMAERCRVSKQTIFNIEHYDVSIAPITREKIELVIGKESE